jgi:hypothetical protein
MPSLDSLSMAWKSPIYFLKIFFHTSLIYIHLLKQEFYSFHHFLKAIKKLVTKHPATIPIKHVNIIMHSPNQLFPGG